MNKIVILIFNNNKKKIGDDCDSYLFASFLFNLQNTGNIWQAKRFNLVFTNLFNLSDDYEIYFFGPLRETDIFHLRTNR